MGKPSGHLTPSARARGYSPEWDRASAEFRQINPLCLGCSSVGKRSKATVTDHVIPHHGNMRLFWDRSRWQPACDHCHNVIKQKLELMLAAGNATPDEMRLNSALAIKLRQRHPPRSKLGLDGWPVN
jgi:hypothetical protein